ncbi:MAG TPA: hypothetical protein VM285_03080 [Polyangia bacterium]|nr:hypothetical protein [Polyangia bacterium]
MSRRLRIKTMWAFVGTDADGDEGVIAFMDPVSREWRPLVGADKERMDSLRPIAQNIADQHGRPVTLVRFDRRSEVEKIHPKESQ